MPRARLFSLATGNLCASVGLRGEYVRSLVRRIYAALSSEGRRVFVAVPDSGVGFSFVRFKSVKGKLRMRPQSAEGTFNFNAGEPMQAILDGNRNRDAGGHYCPRWLHGLPSRWQCLRSMVLGRSAKKLSVRREEVFR